MGYNPNIPQCISRWNNPLIRSPLILTSCPGHPSIPCFSPWKKTGGPGPSCIPMFLHKLRHKEQVGSRDPDVSLLFVDCRGMLRVRWQQRVLLSSKKIRYLKWKESLPKCQLYLRLPFLVLETFGEKNLRIFQKKTRYVWWAFGSNKKSPTIEGPRKCRVENCGDLADTTTSQWGPSSSTFWGRKKDWWHSGGKIPSLKVTARTWK